MLVTVATGSARTASSETTQRRCASCWLKSASRRLKPTSASTPCRENRFLRRDSDKKWRPVNSRGSDVLIDIPLLTRARRRQTQKPRRFRERLLVSYHTIAAPDAPGWIGDASRPRCFPILPRSSQIDIVGFGVWLD